MNGYLQSIRESYAAPLDEERVWINAYGRNVHIPPEEIKEVVESHAEGIESAFNAVTDVFEHEAPKIGIKDEREIILAVIVGRTADVDIVERALDPIDYQIRDEIHKLGRQQEGGDTDE